MSSATRLPTTPAVPDSQSTVSTAVTSLCRALVAGLRALAFWVAVVLPLAYLPMLYEVGITPSATTLVGLVAIHVVAIVVGHGHTPGRN